MGPGIQLPGSEWFIFRGSLFRVPVSAYELSIEVKVSGFQDLGPGFTDPGSVFSIRVYTCSSYTLLFSGSGFRVSGSLLHVQGPNLMVPGFVCLFSGCGYMLQGSRHILQVPDC